MGEEELVSQLTVLYSNIRRKNPKNLLLKLWVDEEGVTKFFLTNNRPDHLNKSSTPITRKRKRYTKSNTTTASPNTVEALQVTSNFNESIVSKISFVRDETPCSCISNTIEDPTDDDTEPEPDTPIEITIPCKNSFSALTDILDDDHQSDPDPLMPADTTDYDDTPADLDDDPPVPADTPADMDDDAPAPSDNLDPADNYVPTESTNLDAALVYCSETCDLKQQPLKLTTRYWDQYYSCSICHLAGQGFELKCAADSELFYCVRCFNEERSKPTHTNHGRKQ